MALLTVEMLAGLRTSVAGALTDSCAVQRIAQVSDGAGGFTDAYATASTVACRVARSGMQSPDEAVFADRLGTRTPFTVYLPWDADVRESDRLAVTLPTGVQTYEVLGVVAPTTSMVFVRCVAARLG
ncbi:MAG TPA: head-tail adaptor protein [Chloroflexota bacterium]|jgi:hypothetical protein|nr:head-tail adaptor protein [Chloroflexota bacterium]